MSGPISRRASRRFRESGRLDVASTLSPSRSFLHTLNYVPRTDWTLLSSSLRFLYLDPVLQYHLQEQAPALIGRSIIDLVHPDEQHAAQRDLSDVLQTGNLDGTLTRFVSISTDRLPFANVNPFYASFP